MRPDTGMNDKCIVVRRLGLCDYLPTWQAMREFTDRRDEQTRSSRTNRNTWPLGGA